LLLQMRVDAVQLPLTNFQCATPFLPAALVVSGRRHAAT
jgi:hypothetical protein